MGDQAQQLPPAGWYRDPENPGGPARWWDGDRWTEQWQAERSDASQAEWIGAVLLLLVPAVLRGIHNANQGEESAYAIGSVFGAMLGPMLLALGIRWLYVRYSEREKPVWTPSVLVIAAAIATIALLGSVAGDSG